MSLNQILSVLGHHSHWQVLVEVSDQTPTSVTETNGSSW